MSGCQVSSGYVMLGQVNSRHFRLGQVLTG